jgi:hypothetical protein
MDMAESMNSGLRREAHGSSLYGDPDRGVKRIDSACDSAHRFPLRPEIGAPGYDPFGRRLKRLRPA